MDKNNLPYKCALLSGSVKNKQSLYKEIELGSIHVIIGTHAVIQKNVRYNKLGVVITDEEHRFGVGQREALSEKGDMPHMLIMSATPIPRSLAMWSYVKI
ncbi:DEAD/DEAH box helicase [Frisingicoccus sp.]|uniref:DEAD/DEAH box helicase n=1 Tax=Frisingicoccus sp. TaxID=1918627 RepID=UPI002FE6D6E1